LSSHSPTHPSPGEIRAALAGVLASSDFQASSQLSQFLTYIVEQTLKGETDTIKGYTIAVEALGRSANFDPQLDPIVRVEATRLRRALAAYYAGQGRDDPWVISIPKGSYIPQFSRAATAADLPGPSTGPMRPDLADTGSQAARTPPVSPPSPPVQPAAPAAAPRPGFSLRALVAVTLSAAVLAVGVMGVALYILGVLPVNQAPARVDIFAAHVPTVEVARFDGDAPSASDITTFANGLRSALSLFDELRVVIDPGQPPDYRMTGSINANASDLTVEARLVHVATGEIVWSARQREFVGLLTRDALAAGLQRQFATAIAQPYGVIYSHLMRRLLNANSLAASHQFDQHYACLLKTFEYWRVFTTAMHAMARGCLEDLTVKTPGFAEAHALLTFMYLDEYRFDYNPVVGAPAPLDRALASARRGVQLAPTSTRALQALIGALYVRGQFKDARALITTVIERNPLDTDMLADMGAKLIVMGEDAMGAKLLAQAATAHPSPPPWHEFFSFLSLWYRDDDAGAARHAVRIDAPEYLLGLTAKLIAADALGNQEERTLLIETITRMAPDFAANPVPLLLRNMPDADLVGAYVRDLRKAGLPVRPDVALLTAPVP
jgi:hypothetical protein